MADLYIRIAVLNQTLKILEFLQDNTLENTILIEILLIEVGQQQLATASYPTKCGWTITSAVTEEPFGTATELGWEPHEFP